MAERKPYLLRLDPAVLDSLQKWAADDLRSLNAQIDYLLRRALREAGRMRQGPEPSPPTSGDTTADDPRGGKG